MIINSVARKFRINSPNEGCKPLTQKKATMIINNILKDLVHMNEQTWLQIGIYKIDVKGGSWVQLIRGEL